jgi:SAM-dependent methyltransferase
MSPPADNQTVPQKAERYEALVDWPRRLAFEEPFYRRLFEQVGVRSVLDAACGTGRHAAMFHSWGLRVEGADVSPAMIAHCREHYGESETLRWVERSFDQAAEPRAAFDAAICVGNSLALAANVAAAKRAVIAILSALRTGGVCIIQVLNLWRLCEGQTTWTKCKRVRIDGSDRILLKGTHRVGATAFVDFLDLTLLDDDVSARFDGVTLLGLEAADLLAAVQRGGGDDPQLYGTFELEPYDREHSPDLILVSRRA